MVNTIIHIGFPKTGTTWFQQQLFPNLSNVNYINKQTTNKLIINVPALEFKKEKITAVFDDLKTSCPLLLSSEKIVGTFNRGWMNGYFPKQNAQKLKDIFEQAEIIVFLRRQQDAISSAYQQYVKNGGNYSIDRYIHNTSTGLFHPDHLKYHLILDYYADLFGIKNLHIYLFEEFKNDPQQFTRTFLNDLNITSNIDKVSFEPINESPGRWAIIPLKILNAFFYKTYPHKHYITPIPFIELLTKKIATSHHFGKKASTQSLLGANNLQYLEDYYKESNNILLAKYNLNAIKKHNYSL